MGGLPPRRRPAGLGLEVEDGDDTIHFVVYDSVEVTPGTYERRIVREGRLTLSVMLSSSIGG